MTPGKTAFIRSSLQLLLGLVRPCREPLCKPKPNMAPNFSYLTTGSISIAPTVENRQGNAKIITSREARRSRRDGEDEIHAQHKAFEIYMHCLWQIKVFQVPFNVSSRRALPTSGYMPKVYRKRKAEGAASSHFRNHGLRGPSLLSCLHMST